MGAVLYYGCVSFINKLIGKNMSNQSFAHEFIGAPVSYSFSKREESVLNLFFTNTNKKIFFIRPALPASVTGALISMYSRIKNPRGIRGHFVDNLLPLILLSFHSLFEAMSSSTVR